MPAIGATVQAGLHVVPVHSASGSPNQAKVAAAADGDSRDRGVWRGIGPLFARAAWPQHMLPQRQMTQPPGVRR